MKPFVSIFLLTMLSLPISASAQGNTTIQNPASSENYEVKGLAHTAQIVQIFTGFMTLIILFQSFRLTKEIKKADIILEFFSRFDKLIDRRESINLSGATTDSKYYYERFWNLQHDEFTLWREGYIDDRTYSSWLNTRHEEYRANLSTGNKTYIEGWNDIKSAYIDTDFQKLIDEVFAGRATDAMKLYKRKKH